MRWLFYTVAAFYLWLIGEEFFYMAVAMYAVWRFVVLLISSEL
jgi:hypothetical protein